MSVTQKNINDWAIDAAGQYQIDSGQFLHYLHGAVSFDSSMSADDVHWLVDNIAKEYRAAYQSTGSWAGANAQMLGFQNPSSKQSQTDASKKLSEKGSAEPATPADNKGIIANTIESMKNAVKMVGSVYGDAADVAAGAREVGASAQSFWEFISQFITNPVLIPVVLVAILLIIFGIGSIFKVNANAIPNPV